MTFTCIHPTPSHHTTHHHTILQSKKTFSSTAAQISILSFPYLPSFFFYLLTSALPPFLPSALPPFLPSSLPFFLDPATNLNRLWNLLQDALIELPATYTLPLINLLQAIQDLPDPDLTSRPTEAAHPARGFTWKGLPGFGHLWADVHKQDNWRNDLSTTFRSPSLTPNDSLQKRQQLRATHIKKANIPLDWGYETIADALELNTAVLDFEVPAAMEWMEVARKELYRGAEEGRESWALRRRDDGREDGRMNLSRWKLWEKRIKEYKERAN